MPVYVYACPRCGCECMGRPTKPDWKGSATLAAPPPDEFRCTRCDYAGALPAPVRRYL